MKKYLARLLFAGFLIFFLLFFFVFNLRNTTHDFLPTLKEELENEDGMLKAWHQEFLMTRDPALNFVPTEKIITAKQKMEENGITSRLTNTASLTWQERGPNNIGGRTRALLADRSDATGNTVFAGGVGGGLWKTTNFKSASPTWSVVNDFFSNIAITCIKQSPTNASEMYFGTGEGFGNIDAIQGLGIWKSTDGGANWTQLSSTTNLSDIEDIEFDDNGYLYAATRSTVASLRGVVRSTNNGTSWTQVLKDPIPTAITRAADLKRAANGDMYATLGIFSTGHIFRSAANGTNTGINGSWTDITPSSIITNKDQRIEIALAPDYPTRIYAISQDSTTDGVGSLFRSDNSGGSWTTLTSASWCDQGSSTNTDFSRGQAWYDLALAVDPNDSNTVLAGGVVVEKSTNSGASWSQMTRWTNGASCTAAPVIHADIHDIQFLNSNELIICSDGGIYYSSNGGTSFTNKNGGYNVTQYYGMAVSPTSGSNTMIAGAQDNGTHLFNATGINSVSSITGGDGGFCFIDKTNSAVWITSNPDGIFNIYRSNGTFAASRGTGNANERFIDPADYADTANILYCGDVDGRYGRLLNVESGITSYNTVNVSASMGSNRQVSCVKVDPGDETTIWLGCSLAEDATANVAPILLKVMNADKSVGGPAPHPSATAFAGPSLPAGAYISSIDIEPGNSNHMLLTVSNYGVASVWESSDGGTSWSSLDNNGVNLPDMPVRWGIFIPGGYNARTTSTAATGGIMLATELGVWSSSSSNGTSTVWTSDNSGLANVRVDQLVLRSSDKLVAAATHGRGVFTALLLSSPLPVTLLNFDGYLQQKNVLLQWTTSSEFNSSHFELEKSFDGKNFRQIARITAAGSSNSLKQYSFLDGEPPSEMNYYRLKMVDVNGHALYSDVKLIRNSGLNQDIYVLGNPFKNEISLRFAKIPQTIVKIRLVNMEGKILLTSEFEQLAQTQISFNSSKLIRGAYILHVETDGKIFNKQIVKQ